MLLTADAVLLFVARRLAHSCAYCNYYIGEMWAFVSQLPAYRIFWRRLGQRLDPNLLALALNTYRGPASAGAVGTNARALIVDLPFSTT